LDSAFVVVHSRSTAGPLVICCAPFRQLKRLKCKKCVGLWSLRLSAARPAAGGPADRLTQRALSRPGTPRQARWLTSVDPRSDPGGDSDAAAFHVRAAERGPKLEMGMARRRSSGLEETTRQRSPPGGRCAEPLNSLTTLSMRSARSWPVRRALAGVAMPPSKAKSICPQISAMEIRTSETFGSCP
jgi:hypothetical protein